MKLKVCDACQKETVIWKNHGGFKYCKYCWSCQKAIDSDSVQKPTDYKIPQVSSKSTWLAVCRNCHDWVHSHPKESRALGYLK